jgi:hypothetical protein
VASDLRRRLGGTSRRKVAVALVSLLVATTALVTRFLVSDPDPAPAANPSTAAAGACGSEPPEGSLSARVTDALGACYGYADAGPGFGRNHSVLGVQADLFAGNRPLAAGDLTVVWFGALSCPAYRVDGTCSNGQLFDTQFQELQGLRLAQLRGDLGTRVHVVIADAGSGMAYAEQVARLIAQRSASFGRLVVIGGGESRQETRQAISILLDAGIPVIAPTLNADQDAPGRPFIDRPGFLQLSPPNRVWATAAAAFIAHYTPAGSTRQVIVYHSPAPGDEYTESLAQDMLAAARANPVTAAQPPQLVSAIGQLPRSVCRDTPAGTAPPPAVFYADRNTGFKTFAEGVTARCGPDGPAMLVTSDSVNHFMASDDARASLDAPWPMAGFRKGGQCSDLVAAAAREKGSGEATALLAAARGILGSCSLTAAASQQVGARVSLLWDAVTLAAKVTPTSQAGPVIDAIVAASTTTVTVRNGQVVSTSPPLPPLCVLSVDRTTDGGRASANCDTAFGVSQELQ